MNFLTVMSGWPDSDTHYYPPAEVDAMTTAYAGKRCIITRESAAQWAHILDANLDNSSCVSLPLISCLCLVAFFLPLI
jgi:hypothetical protein